MDKYFQETRYELQQISFGFLGGRYAGDGIMYWKPEDGFTIEARVDRHGPPPPGAIELRSLSVPKDADYSIIRMRLSTGAWAMTRVYLNRLFSLHSKWFSVPSARMIFYQPNPWEKPSDFRHGSALYAGSDKISLPYMLEREVRLQDEILEKRYDRKGIVHATEAGLRLLGKVSDDSKTVSFHWRLPKSEWNRTENWRWATATKDALGILSQQTVELLMCEVAFGPRIRIDMRQFRKGHDLDICAPFRDDFVDAERLAALASFLGKGGEKAEICRRIIWQLSSAAQQKTWESKELLVGTILESVLRTLYSISYKKSFQIEQCLDQFRQEYLTDLWIPWCSKALVARKLLRQRNAHQEWISCAGGSHSHEEMVKSIDAIILLSHFCGQMILALAGFQNLEPRFPLPHEQWRPMSTYHRAPKDDA